jgi:hypothetical protein
MEGGSPFRLLTFRLSSPGASFLGYVPEREVVHGAPNQLRHPRRQ